MNNSWQDDSTLRQQVYTRLREFGIDAGGDFVGHLSQLMGRKEHNYFALGVHCTPREREVCRMLLGPHGRTIYKVLTARINHEEANAIGCGR